jgi:alpha-tubulin suppressor-like RCC1 family protein
VDAAGRLECNNRVLFSGATPVATMPAVRMQSVAAGTDHPLALGCDGRVYSWGSNS